MGISTPAKGSSYEVEAQCHNGDRANDPNFTHGFWVMRGMFKAQKMPALFQQLQIAIAFV